MKFPNIKLTLETYWRILRLTKKPTWDDYLFTAKICAIGLMIIATLGFMLYALATVLGL